jgi:hypothetical protein
MKRAMWAGGPVEMNTFRRGAMNWGAEAGGLLTI